MPKISIPSFAQKLSAEAAMPPISAGLKRRIRVEFIPESLAVDEATGLRMFSLDKAKGVDVTQPGWKLTLAGKQARRAFWEICRSTGVRKMPGEVYPVCALVRAAQEFGKI